MIFYVVFNTNVYNTAENSVVEGADVQRSFKISCTVTSDKSTSLPPISAKNYPIWQQTEPLFKYEKETVN